MSPKKLGLITIVIAILIIIGFLVFANGDDQSGSDESNSGPTTSSTADNTNQSTSDSTKTFSLADVAKHNNADDCWTTINGVVYDVTDFISQHPGGKEILRACGIDGTSLFTLRKTADGETVGSGTPHSSSAEAQLEQLKIGTLSQ